MVVGEQNGPPADLWPFYKELLATVEAAVVLKQPGVRYKGCCYIVLFAIAALCCVSNPFLAVSGSDLLG